MSKKRVIIIGGGFGGLSAALKLKDSDFEITIIDKTNHHLFQPLLYQVAAAALSPGDIAMPIRAVFRNYKNVHIILGEAYSVDKDNKTVSVNGSNIKLDYLILAPGSRHSYFGKPEWEKFAPGLKTLDDALYIREKILLSLEEAEKIDNKDLVKKYLTFVIIGGGPTGVELAGAIAEIAKQTMIKDYKRINKSQTKIYLVEGLSKILPAYPNDLSDRAKKDLENLGVVVKLNSRVSEITSEGVTAGGEFIESKNIIWAAGNQVMPLIKSLGVETDSAGRAIVNPDLTIKNYPNIFIIGDAAAVKDSTGNLLPGIAPVAMQQGAYAAKIILRHELSSSRPPFEYLDKGIIATIGKAKAVALIKGLKLKGFVAWVTWSVVHIFYLISFRNRFRVMAEWIWYYFTKRQGIRLIVGRSKRTE
jgi:NADH dehydrogenase